MRNRGDQAAKHHAVIFGRRAQAWFRGAPPIIGSDWCSGLFDSKMIARSMSFPRRTQPLWVDLKRFKSSCEEGNFVGRGQEDFETPFCMAPEDRNETSSNRMSFVQPPAPRNYDLQ